MKARVINKRSEYYGKIVNVKKMEDTRFFANRYKMIYGKGVFFGDELEFDIEKEHNINSENDWSAFRRDAAKDILAGMMANVPRLEYGINDAECMAEYAVLYAEKLIKRLKEGQA